MLTDWLNEERLESTQKCVHVNVCERNEREKKEGAHADWLTREY